MRKKALKKRPPQATSRKRARVAKPIAQKSVKDNNQQLLIVMGLIFVCLLIGAIVTMNIINERKLEELERQAQIKILAQKNKAAMEAKREAAVRRQKERLEKAAKKKLVAQQLAAKRALLQAQIAADNFKKEQKTQSIEVVQEASAQNIGGDQAVQTQYSSVIEQQDKKTAEVMTAIKDAIRPMIQAEDYAGAIKYLQNYAGDGASLTKERRDGIVELLQRKLNGE